MSTPRHRRVSTQTFFGFSIQDKYLSEIRLEAKQQKESFDAKNLVDIYQTYKDQPSFNLLNQLSCSISAELGEITNLKPGKQTIEHATHLLSNIKASLAEMAALTESNLGYPDLATWLDNKINRATSPFHVEDLKPVMRVNSSPELRGRSPNQNFDQHFNPLDVLDLSEINLEDKNNDESFSLDYSESESPLQPDHLTPSVKGVNSSNIASVFQQLENAIPRHRFEREEKEHEKGLLHRANSSPELQGRGYNSQHFHQLAGDIRRTLNTGEINEMVALMKEKFNSFKL